MESAKLTEAHEHVRNAANATYGHSIATAGHEHELAAQAFHDAAHETTNSEALRILGLLQDHHNKLARLIKETPKNKPRQKDRDKTKDAEAPPVDQPTSPPTKGSAARTSSPSTSSPTRAPSHRRLPQSSIASNLAEKRGIPGARRSTPTTTPVSVANALATRNEQPATPVRDLLERQSRKAEASRHRESAAQDTNDAPARAAPSSPTDDSFQRFYTTFGGIISAISAPLAFTSLPLSPAPPTPDEPSSPTKDKAKKPRNESPSASRTIKSSEPDLSSLISKPALRALREDGAAPLGPFANNESFYLVPTSGGTVSYASIVRDPQAHHHHAAQNPHLSSIDEGSSEGLKSSSHEEFVDARESVGPPSPTVPRRPRSQGKSATSPSGAVANARTIAAGRGAGLKTMEEYDLEIETLKQLVDKQAKRLSMWESNSQASYNALAQSFRARNGGRTPSDPAALAHALASQHPAAMAAAAVPAPAVASTSAAGTPATPAQQHQQQQPQSPQSPDPSTQRIAALEALLADATAKLDHANATADQLAKQNEKNSQVIGRYREQWEKLKAGARKKEQERRERRVAELKAGQARARESAESGEGTGREDGEGEGEGEAEGGIGIGVEEEAGFGKA